LNGPSAAPAGARRPGVWLAAGAALLAVALAAAGSGLRPPPPRPPTAPPGAFSADRALARLRPVLAAAGEATGAPGTGKASAPEGPGGRSREGGGPHPVGSAANARVRDRLVEELGALGLRPEVHTSFACGRYRFCAQVSNVLARVPGRGSGKAVLLAAHHDSVPAGPGAADDGVGLAVALEAARALVAEPAARDVLLLLDDGEEIGLAGAEAFLRHPLAREVGAVVNLEARGTGGPALVFETAGPGAFVAARLADLPTPMASSAFTAVYRLLPNDTDLTVLAALGVPGANLALVEGGVRYHTPRDDLAHLEAASVQHMGESALALVRALAAAPQPAEPGEAVYFDLLGRVLVRFPEGLARPLALLALGLALGAGAMEIRRGRTRPRRVALGLLGSAAALVAAAASGSLAGRALGLDPILRPWVATPAPLVASFVAGGALGAALAAAIAAAGAGPDGLRAAVRVVLGAGAVALATALPGASHLLLVPALAAGGLGAAGSLRRDPGAGPATDVAIALAAGVVLFPVAWLLEPALGHGAGPAVSTAVAIAALPLAPLAAGLPPGARRRLAAGLAASAAGLALAARSLPYAGEDAPERVVVCFHQDADTGQARILASPDLERLPGAVRAAAAFSGERVLPFGWAALRPSFAAPVAPLPLPGPELEIRSLSREGEGLRLRARLRSPRGAEEGHVAVPPGTRVVAAAIDGLAVPPTPPRVARWFGDWAVLRNATLPPEGTELDLLLAGPEPIEIQIGDQSSGLPPAAALVAAARPAAAVTAQEGDVTLFTQTVRLTVR
jgi:hypothetical protein